MLGGVKAKLHIKLTRKDGDKKTNKSLYSLVIKTGLKYLKQCAIWPCVLCVPNMNFHQFLCSITPKYVRMTSAYTKKVLQSVLKPQVN